MDKKEKVKNQFYGLVVNKVLTIAIRGAIGKSDIFFRWRLFQLRAQEQPLMYGKTPRLGGALFHIR
jgi:hypothetical protein